ncbi:DNA cytosine methyltransferase (plasmid) [Halarchaeum sp. CBA1220]|uniref:DNA cytosine methyltransferase n=1 Tax=Halarchaeum sp. CBA1220 TaxID=1853682 RepID=UPI000F3A966C|nr:DNA cytosine methyltransferase [Halarchaeum sp. CBA1220]QLC35685.1 DNA cytosine methyltransferase [Halarchaeum sp. CBA1220]
MPEPVTSSDSPLALIRSASNTERDIHRELLTENIDFLIETLTAAHARKQKQSPVGCPSATPEQLARKRGKHGDDCRYALVDREYTANSEVPCPCGDPLSGSDDPLDAVAAVVLAGPAESPAERFFERDSRETISELRNQHGTWGDIATMDQGELAASLGEITRGGKKEREQTASWLRELLDAVKETHYTEGVTLRNFSRVRYDHYVDFLTTLPFIQEGDGWWLVQTAFDKPVWPADSRVDELLCSLGLLEPMALRDDSDRRTSLEEQFLDRHLAPLYRALATHAVTAGTDVCGEDCEIKKFLLTHRIRQQRAERSGPTAVDLFAGAGGLSCGLNEAGFDVRWAIDIEPDAVSTYRLNHPELPHQNVICGDVQEIDLPERIREVAGTPDIIVGGPPCQSLSNAGYRSRRADDDDYSILDDDRTTLYTQYVNTVDELRPKAILMENVEGMVNEVGDSGIRVIDWVLEDLKLLGETGPGYDIDYRLQDMTELGVPQNRERVLLVGIREDLAQNPSTAAEVLSELPSEGSARTIQQGLSGLPRLRRGEGGRVLAETPRGSKSNYVNEHQLASGTDLCFNHRAREHPMEKDRILFDEALSPGDTGWDVKYGSDGEYAEYVEYDVGTAESSRFGDKYRMLEWSESSPTIVAHLAKDANGYVLPDYYKHARPDPDRADPERNRGITPREAARLQSFPDDYIFLGPFTSWFRQIGNAVPPIAGKRIGEALSSVVESMAPPEVKADTTDHDEAVSDD